MSGFSVLITLDGTSLAEEALSLLPFLKSIGATSAHLVGVWEDLEEPDGRNRFSETNEQGRALLTAYLESTMNAMQTPGLEIHSTVRTGNAAAEVLGVANETKPDLIAIATHGRAGIDRWRLGSVADKVVRAASCPTLVIGPNVKVGLEKYAAERILVPLDGSDSAEQALPVARALAMRTGAVIELIEVPNLPTPWTADPYGGIGVGQAIGWLEEGARDYLQKIDLPGLTPERTVLRFVATGGVGSALLGHLSDKPADLIVMTSHGRHGVSRWALGSVTDELLRGPAPVLVLRPGERDFSQLIATDERSLET